MPNMESLVNKPAAYIATWLAEWESTFSKQWGFDVKLEFLREENGVSKPESLLSSIKEGSQIPFNTSLNIQLRKVESKEYEKERGISMLYSVTCYTMPALCGTLIFTYLQRSQRNTYPSPKDSSLLFIEFIKSYAAARRYSNIICSNIVPRLPQKLNYTAYPSEPANIEYLKGHGIWHGFKFKQNLLRAGFSVTTEFINKRTENLINIFNINLYKNDNL